MKSILSILFILITANTAFSHIEKGTWKGRISETANCFMDVGDTTFNSNIKNPLNERISIQIGSTTYSVKHPHFIDSQSGTISFNHDLLEDVVPTATGAFALQIKMVHSASFEGPASLSVMEHDWKSDFKEVVQCNDLKKVD